MSNSSIEAHSSKPELNAWINAERVKAIYKQAYMTGINSWATALLFIFIPNDTVSKTTLLAWFAAVTVTCLARLFVAKYFSMQTLALHEYPRWGLIYAAVVGSTALAWSAGLFILTSPVNTEYQLFMMMVLIALCIGASHSSTTYPLVGQVYNLPAMTAMIITCVMTGGIGFYIMALLGLMFAVMMIVVGRDSDRRFKEVQELRFELSKQKEDAENANVAKSRFLAAASHDLRQPLHALTLFTGLLKEKITYPDVLKIVDNIDNSVDALQSLFNSLLDISKLDAGTIEVELNDFSLNDVLLPIENEFKVEAKEKDIELFIEPRIERVHSDFNLLSRIIRNLVSNAVRYTEHGSVLVLCKKQGDFVAIEVRDTGIGIPLNKHQEVFDEFVQLNNPERDRNKGLGLGLAIVNRLTKLLDYQLQLQSTAESGTSFILEIPLAKNQAPQKEAPKNQDILASLSLQGLRVFVIDDESDIREGTVGLLSSWECQAYGFESSSAAEAFIKSESFSPEVLLVDYRLQDNKTGIEAAKSISSLLDNDIPAAIITGDTAADRLQEADASGYTLLHKPVKAMQLRSFLTRVKNRKGKAETNIVEVQRN
ncbi:MAG: hybrid sensor histidine kinase/response regulator [Agarilytica sp.]